MSVSLLKLRLQNVGCKLPTFCNYFNLGEKDILKIYDSSHIDSNIY